jgi:CopG family transcriptional regulator, nickel-responsive regulator
LQSNLKLSGDKMDAELMRIGVSLPDTLLGKFDEIIEKRGYSSRSEGIRDAIRSYISHYEWMGEVKGHRVGTIAVIYDHTKRGLSNALADIEHHYGQLIKSSVHIHLDHDNCFEVIVLDGDGEEIKELTEAILSLKGVKFSKLTTVASSEKI